MFLMSYNMKLREMFYFVGFVSFKQQHVQLWSTAVDGGYYVNLTCISLTQ